MRRSLAAAILPDGGKKIGTRESPNGERGSAGSEQSAANRVPLFYRADRRGEFREQLMDRHVKTVQIGHGKEQQLPYSKPVYDSCL